MDTKPDDFRILPLRCDRDALMLIALSVIAVVLVFVGLAFLPDEAWDRLESRSQLLWGALAAIAPALIAAWQRMSLRKEAVKALGKAASAPLSIETTPMMYADDVAVDGDTDA